MNQHRSQNRAARHLVDLDTRYRERLRRGRKPSSVETIPTDPADGTLLDVVPLPDTGKVLMIVAHVVPTSAALPFPAPETHEETSADSVALPDTAVASYASPRPADLAHPADLADRLLADPDDLGDRRNPTEDETPPTGEDPGRESPTGQDVAGQTGARPKALRIDEPSRRVWVEGREIRLTYQEFELLVHFTMHPWRVFSRAQLMQALWPAVDATTRTVDVHVHRLRRKLGPVGDHLATVRRVGYVYRPQLTNRTELATTRD
jgi:DNA-binding winged helix-turn-helix (wHTH) protein